MNKRLFATAVLGASILGAVAIGSAEAIHSSAPTPPTHPAPEMTPIGRNATTVQYPPGVPAIAPSILSPGSNAPAFTEADVRQFLAGHQFFQPLNGSAGAVSKVLFT